MPKILKFLIFVLLFAQWSWTKSRLFLFPLKRPLAQFNMVPLNPKWPKYIISIRSFWKKVVLKFFKKRGWKNGRFWPDFKKVPIFDPFNLILWSLCRYDRIFYLLRRIQNKFYNNYKSKFDFPGAIQSFEKKRKNL